MNPGPTTKTWQKLSAFPSLQNIGHFFKVFESYDRGNMAKIHEPSFHLSIKYCHQVRNRLRYTTGHTATNMFLIFISYLKGGCGFSASQNCTDNYHCLLSSPHIVHIYFKDREIVWVQAYINITFNTVIVL